MSAKIASSLRRFLSRGMSRLASGVKCLGYSAKQCSKIFSQYMKAYYTAIISIATGPLMATQSQYLKKFLKFMSVKSLGDQNANARVNSPPQ